MKTWERNLQAAIDYMAESGRDKTEVDFDDLNSAMGEIERLRAESDHWFSLVSRADRALFPFTAQGNASETDPSESR